jgi:RimJ/RimL family protein N-acetyltransferase
MGSDRYSGKGCRSALILAGQKQAVRDWIFARVRDLTDPPQDLYEAIGVVSDGKLIGGVLYSNYHEIAPGQHDCMLTAAGEPGWLTRSTIRVLLSYPFRDLRCVRLTSVIAKSNKTARALNERLGFKIEGKIRDGRGTGKHCILYGLLKADAERWLR